MWLDMVLRLQLANSGEAERLRDEADELTAIFVAFRPQWLLTWSDARYLPPPVR